MTDGDATPAQMGAYLMALRVRGETVDEITSRSSGAWPPGEIVGEYIDSDRR